MKEFHSVSEFMQAFYHTFAGHTILLEQSMIDRRENG